MSRVLVSLAAVLVFAAPALAQVPPGGGEEEYDVEAALREVSRLLSEAESLLVKALKPGGSAAGAADAGEKAREEMEKLLSQGGENGKKAVDKMTEILENAPQQSGQGQGQEQEKPDESEDAKRKEQEQKVGDRDPKNSGEPEDGKERKERPESGTDKPKDKPKDPASDPDPNKDWLANLPEKVRQAYLNGEWEIIPAKWRRLIEEYTKKVAGSDR